MNGSGNVSAPAHSLATVSNSGTGNPVDGDESVSDTMSLDAQVDRFLNSVSGSGQGMLGVMDTVVESIEEL